MAAAAPQLGCLHRARQLSETPPDPRGSGNILTRKLGPLPGWAWLGLVVGGAAVIIYVRRKRAASASTGASGTAASSGGCTDAAGNPADCGSAAAVSDIGTSQWEALYTQQQGMESTLQNIYALLQGTQGGPASPGGDSTGTSGPPPGDSGGGPGSPPPGGPLPQPAGLHLTVNGPHSARLAWTAVPGADGYVWQLKEGGDNGKVIAGPTSVALTYAYFAGLKASTRYTALVWPSSPAQKGGPGTPQPHAEFEFTTTAK